MSLPLESSWKRRKISSDSSTKDPLASLTHKSLEDTGVTTPSLTQAAPSTNYKTPLSIHLRPCSYTDRVLEYDYEHSEDEYEHEAMQDYGQTYAQGGDDSDHELILDDEDDEDPLEPDVQPGTPPRISLDEEAKHEMLMRRREALDRANFLSGPISRSTDMADIIDDDMILEETQGGDNSQEGYLGNSSISTSTSRSMRSVEELVDEDEIRRQQALRYLESLVMSFLEQINMSTTILDNQEKTADTKQIKRKRSLNEEDSQPNPEENEMGDESQEKEDASCGKGQGIGITLALLNRQTGCVYYASQVGSREVVDAPCSNDQIISFPDDPLASGTRDTSASRFVAVALYEAILHRTSITLRDIYYRDKALFKRQDVVDKLVNDLVGSAGLKRKDFHVVSRVVPMMLPPSNSKRLLLLTAHDITAKKQQSQRAMRATLIDPMEKIHHLEAPEGVAWVLIVEKDTLCSARLLEDSRVGPGILVTGKGYPDLATRQFLRLVADTFPEARFHALVDADPHGLNILSNYVFGAKKTAHSHDHAGLVLGQRVAWLGLKASDWKSLGIRYEALLPLEKADVVLGTSMLRQHETLPTEWKQELCRMLHLNRKAEIEIILGSTATSDTDPFKNGVSHGSIFDDEKGSSANPADGGAGGLPDFIGESGAQKLVEYIVARIRAV